jgi:hypothetical protein
MTTTLLAEREQAVKDQFQFDLWDATWFLKYVEGNTDPSVAQIEATLSMINERRRRRPSGAKMALIKALRKLDLGRCGMTEDDADRTYGPDVLKENCPNDWEAGKYLHELVEQAGKTDWFNL